MTKMNLNTVNIQKSVASGAVPHFQPILTPTNRSSFAYEALGRLDYEGLILTPSELFPHLEHTPYMAEFDRAILSRAIEQMAKWNHFGDVNVNLHVNASADVLAQSSYADFVSEQLNLHQVLPESLTIELVETCKFWKSPVILQTMTAIKQLGVKVAIDDFPCWPDTQDLINWLMLNSDKVDSIKIDKSLVLEVCDGPSSINPKLEELIHYVVMAHNLGLSVIAEGVRNERDMRIMRLCKADAVQGFGIGRPQPASQAYHLKCREKVHCPTPFNQISTKQNFVSHGHV